jgi:acyl-CoA synthetase (NDP forming)
MPRSFSSAASANAFNRHASIAVIGASENPNKIGGRPIAYLARFGFRGEVYPINPARETVQGLHAFAGLSALPAGPDVAVIAPPSPSPPCAPYR